MFIAALFLKVKIWEQHGGSKVRYWLKISNVVMHIHSRNSLTRKNKIMQFVAIWTYSESVMLSEIRRDIDTDYFLSHVKYKKIIDI